MIEIHAVTSKNLPEFIGDERITDDAIIQLMSANKARRIAEEIEAAASSADIIAVVIQKDEQ